MRTKRSTRVMKRKVHPIVRIRRTSLLLRMAVKPRGPKRVKTTLKGAAKNPKVAALKTRATLGVKRNITVNTARTVFTSLCTKL